MEMTAVGYVLIPVGIVAFFARAKTPLLHLLVFFCPFSATAIVNFTGWNFGVQPAYFFGILYLLRCVLDASLRHDFRLAKAPYRALLPFWAFVFVALLSVLVVPFRTPVRILRPSGAIELLALTRENLTQLTYLIYVVALASAIGLSGLGPGEVGRAMKVLLVSAVVVCLWGWFQVAMYANGRPYRRHRRNGF